MEKRKPLPPSATLTQRQGVELPLDYLKMVVEVFGANFAEGLSRLGGAGQVGFVADGRIYQDEILLALSLKFEGRMSAITLHASSDFDPQASSPTAETLLGLNVDALGAYYSDLLDPQKPEDHFGRVSEADFEALGNVPYEWTAVDAGKRKVYLRMDKSNLKLDQMTDDWLAKNDPDYQDTLNDEQAETEAKFVTGTPAGKKKVH
ncbi:MAG: hypothetical protein AB7P04_08395 [Bacteriovoracia bacterium]